MISAATSARLQQLADQSRIKYAARRAALEAASGVSIWRHVRKRKYGAQIRRYFMAPGTGKTAVVTEEGDKIINVTVKGD